MHILFPKLYIEKGASHDQIFAELTSSLIEYDVSDFYWLSELIWNPKLKKLEEQKTPIHAIVLESSSSIENLRKSYQKISCKNLGENIYIVAMNSFSNAKTSGFILAKLDYSQNKIKKNLKSLTACDLKSKPYYKQLYLKNKPSDELSTKKQSHTHSYSILGNLKSKDIHNKKGAEVKFYNLSTLSFFKS